MIRVDGKVQAPQSESDSALEDSSSGEEEESDSDQDQIQAPTVKKGKDFNQGCGFVEI